MNEKVAWLVAEVEQDDFTPMGVYSTQTDAALALTKLGATHTHVSADFVGAQVWTATVRTPVKGRGAAKGKTKPKYRADRVYKRVTFELIPLPFNRERLDMPQDPMSDFVQGWTKAINDTTLPRCTKHK